MCEPFTIAAVAVAAVGAVSAINEGQAANKESEFQADIAKHNSIIADRKASDARARGEIAARQQQLDTAQIIGRQRAAAAGSGVRVDTGSALDLTIDVAGFGKLDELTVRNNAEREALGFESQANVLRAQRQSLQAQGKNAQVQGFLGAAGSIAGAFGSGALGGAPSGAGSTTSDIVGANVAQGNPTGSGFTGSFGKSTLGGAASVNPKWLRGV